MPSYKRSTPIGHAHKVHELGEVAYESDVAACTFYWTFRPLLRFKMIVCAEAKIFSYLEGS